MTLTHKFPDKLRIEFASPLIFQVEDGAIAPGQIEVLVGKIKDAVQTVVTGAITQMLNKIDAKLTELTDAVAQETTVNASAITLITGFGQKLTDAVAAAKADGATDAQLQAFTDLATGIKADSSALAAAVTANTGTTPPPAGGPPVG